MACASRSNIRKARSGLERRASLVLELEGLDRCAQEGDESRLRRIECSVVVVGGECLCVDGRWFDASQQFGCGDGGAVLWHDGALFRKLGCLSRDFERKNDIVVESRH